MAIVKCVHGHYYDDEKYSDCPMCKNANHNNVDIKTVGLYSTSKNNNDEKTIGINLKKNSCDPVVGWLVCIEGPDRGRDFRIHSGRNFMGRDYKNDIPISGDSSITRENAGYIIYEPRKNVFMVANGESMSMFVNDKEIINPCILNDGDKISIGTYVFELVIYCKGDKKW